MRPVLIGLALALLAPMPASAMTAAPAVERHDRPLTFIADDEDVIHGIISDQIQAFLHDDGETAYSFAAPSLKQYFPTADGFMAMVRNGYQPIYRAQRFNFGTLEQSDGKYVQSVTIVGPDGQIWRAVYTLVRQEDGSLKIVSCYLLKVVAA